MKGFSRGSGYFCHLPRSCLCQGCHVPFTQRGSRGPERVRDLPKVTQPISAWAPSPFALWLGLVLRDGTQPPAACCPARLQPWAVHSVFPHSLLLSFPRLGLGLWFPI